MIIFADERVIGGPRVGKHPAKPGLPAVRRTAPSSTVRARGGMSVRGIIVSAAALAFVAGGAAGAATIDVTPSSSHPGEKVHISVPGCGVGPSSHVAVSPAFAGNVALFGKADTGDADPVIRQELKPGVYPITAYCGTSTVRGQISVTAGKGPSAGDDGKTNGWLLLVVALVIAGVAATFLLGRRRRPNG